MTWFWDIRKDNVRQYSVLVIYLIESIFVLDCLYLSSRYEHSYLLSLMTHTQTVFQFCRLVAGLRVQEEFWEDFEDGGSPHLQSVLGQSFGSPRL